MKSQWRVLLELEVAMSKKKGPALYELIISSAGEP